MQADRTLILGLDGATFDILSPLIRRGELPCMQDICTQGAWGPLKSIFPPVTGPAWVSMATGRNPGKTGVFDFLTVTDRKTLQTEPVGAKHFRGRSLWDHLGESGHRVGVFNFPMLFPPYPVNGFLVSGIGSSEEETITYPSELQTELDEVTGGYEIRVEYSNSKYTRNPALLVEDLQRVFRKRSLALNHLLFNKEWDFFWGVLSITDWMQHYLWKFIDTSHPAYDPQAATQWRSVFEELWKEVDGYLGQLRERLGGKTNLFIVSDHGFGPSVETFYLNAWLEQEGYLVRRGASAKGFLNRVIYPVLKAAGNLTLRHLVPGHYAKLRRGVRHLRNPIVDEIDFDRSTALSSIHSPPFGPIYLLVEEERERRRLAVEIEEKLHNLTRPDGSKLQVVVLQGKEEYEGPFVERAPDLLVNIGDHSCAIRSNRSEVIYENSVPWNKSGDHRLNGILMAVGPDIRNATIKNARLLDICPTIFHLYDLPSPSDFDGEVLEEMLSFKKMPMPKYASEQHSNLPSDLNRDDKEEVIERLRMLGYL